MIDNEDFVYYYVKKHLRQAGIAVFGGEPPGGTDDLHRIELKRPNSQKKGSRGSRKFDLLAYFEKKIILIELKSDSSQLSKDVEKLEDTVESEGWTAALWTSIKERKLFGKVLPEIERDEFIEKRRSLIVKALGSKPSGYIPPNDFLLFETTEEMLDVRATKFEDTAFFSALREKLKHVV